MVEVIGGESHENSSLPIANLPPSALQAIYHHVTGKTENMSQSFNGNVLIESHDVDRLHQMIIDQVATHHVEFGPTVTIEVKHANERSFHHSSWEHYKNIVPANNEITSEITLKFEFVLDLQNTAGPQRCSVSIMMDSSLPVINDEKFLGKRPYGFWVFFSREWMTARVSIDFVDFMIARGFAGVVEEWFKGLAPSPTPILNSKLLNGYGVFSSISSQMGRLGFSIFLAIYVYLNQSTLELARLTYAVCAGFSVWSLYAIIRPPIMQAILKRITSNIVPSVLLLSPADKKCYDRIAKALSSTRATVAGMVMTILLSVAINLISSYIYSYYTGK